MTILKAVAATIVSAVGALIVALGAGTNQTIGSIDTTHWLLVGLTVLGSGGLVYWLSNLPGVAGQVAKAIVAFLSAGIASLIVALQDNVITQPEWLVAFSAAVAATGLVYQLKNTTSA